MTNRNGKGVLLVANYAPDVGYAWWLMEAFWIAIARLAEARGDHAVLTYPAPGTLPARIEAAPLTVTWCDFSDRSLAGLVRLYRLIRRERIRCVYLTDQPYIDPRYLLLRCWGVRHIVLHDHTPGERDRPGPLKGFVKRVLHRLRLLSADRYIGVSRFVQERLVSVACVPLKRCGYVHNGIAPPDNLTADRTFLRDTFDIPLDALVVVSTGRATRYKGVGFIIEIAARMAALHPDAELYFLHCGAGPDLEAFQAQTETLGIASRFRFAGHRDDVPRILAACDIALHASAGEAFSLSILEYMGAGLAVLAPRHCGNAEAIEHGVSGMLYTPGSEQEVVDLLRRLTEDPDLRQALGTRARSRVLECFTLDRCVEKFVNEIEAHL